MPSFRVDVAREADLIEEVGRHWGFDRIPATFPRAAEPAAACRPPRASRAIAALRRLLCGAGLQEAVTFTFIERAAAPPFAPGGETPVAIANPLSEKFAVLRPSLAAGPRSTRSSTTGVASRPTSGSSRWAPCSRRARRVAAVWLGADGSRGRALERTRRRRSDFFDAKGVAELARPRASASS